MQNMDGDKHRILFKANKLFVYLGCRKQPDLKVYAYKLGWAIYLRNLSVFSGVKCVALEKVSSCSEEKSKERNERVMKQ